MEQIVIGQSSIPMKVGPCRMHLPFELEIEIVWPAVEVATTYDTVLPKRQMGDVPLVGIAAVVGAYDAHLALRVHKVTEVLAFLDQVFAYLRLTIGAFQELQT